VAYYKLFMPNKSTYDNSAPLEPIVSSAYVLFLGHRVSQDARHTVGGLPIIPRMPDEQVEDVIRVLGELLDIGGSL
jgi:hypothetical protein